mmetsp:Transcript_14475/g.31423  ORF Transcript_14475/g.31423 Transcript_14475/m.31423 type:complete len:536 (+) Transcript_14475:1955-3562(+)
MLSATTSPAEAVHHRAVAVAAHKCSTVAENRAVTVSRVSAAAVIVSGSICSAVPLWAQLITTAGGVRAVLHNRRQGGVGELADVALAMHRNLLQLDEEGLVVLGALDGVAIGVLQHKRQASLPEDALQRELQDGNVRLLGPHLPSCSGLVRGCKAAQAAAANVQHGHGLGDQCGGHCALAGVPRVLGVGAPASRGLVRPVGPLAVRAAPVELQAALAPSSRRHVHRNANHCCTTVLPRPGLSDGHPGQQGHVAVTTTLLGHLGHKPVLQHVQLTGQAQVEPLADLFAQHRLQVLDGALALQHLHVSVVGAANVQGVLNHAGHQGHVAADGSRVQPLQLQRLWPLPSEEARDVQHVTAAVAGRQPLLCLLAVRLHVLDGLLKCPPGRQRSLHLLLNLLRDFTFLVPGCSSGALNLVGSLPSHLDGGHGGCQLELTCPQQRAGCKVCGVSSSCCGSGERCLCLLDTQLVLKVRELRPHRGRPVTEDGVHVGARHVLHRHVLLGGIHLHLHLPQRRLSALNVLLSCNDRCSCRLDIIL